MGIAVTADGAVWATLQNGNHLLRVTADGTGKSIPTCRAVAPCRLTSRLAPTVRCGSCSSAPIESGV